MQDARINNLDGEKKPVHNLTKFYLGLMRRMCEEERIKTPINWKAGEAAWTVAHDATQDAEVTARMDRIGESS